MLTRSSARFLTKTLAEFRHDAVLDASRRQPDRVRDRHTRGVAVRDDDEAAQPQQVSAAVRLRIEARAEPPRGRPDQQSAELAARRPLDLGPQAVKHREDRALEQLQRDIAGEAVGDDDVRRALQQPAALDVALESQVAFREQPVRLLRRLVALRGLFADRQQADLRLARSRGSPGRRSRPSSRTGAGARAATRRSRRRRSAPTAPARTG